MKFSKRGAVPIPYIIAIIFAVAIIVLIGYWLFSTNNEFSKVIKAKMCDTKKAAYCSDWRLSGTKPEMEFSTLCGNIVHDDPDDENYKDNFYAPVCCIFDWAEDDLDSTECDI